MMTARGIRCKNNTRVEEEEEKVEKEEEDAEMISAVHRDGHSMRQWTKL